MCLRSCCKGQGQEAEVITGTGPQFQPSYVEDRASHPPTSWGHLHLFRGGTPSHPWAKTTGRGSDFGPKEQQHLLSVWRPAGRGRGSVCLCVLLVGNVVHLTSSPVRVAVKAESLPY